MLDRQIRRWNGALPAGVLHFGLIWWSRLHGLTSLELGRHLVATGVDPTELYRTEIETMLSSLRRHSVTTHSGATSPSTSIRSVTMRR